MAQLPVWLSFQDFPATEVDLKVLKMCVAVTHHMVKNNQLLSNCSQRKTVFFIDHTQPSSQRPFLDVDFNLFLFCSSLGTAF